MDKLVVVGGKKLEGSVRISGAKNAVLPIMAATLLCDGKYEISNVPQLKDVKTMAKLLASIGIEIKFENDNVDIFSQTCSSLEAPYDLVKTMRASIYVLGPLVARFGYAKVSLPGGCAWGPRPVNLHIEGLRRLGAEIEIDSGYIVAKAEKLKGTHISLDLPSVGATGNLLMAASLAEGTTIIENAAKEPEIIALAKFLKSMGADIKGDGTERIEIKGVEKLSPADCEIIPDRIEAATFMVAAHITGGDVIIENMLPEQVSAVTDKLIDSGAEIEINGRSMHVSSDGRVSPVDVTTAVYPGFPTDMQAQWMALMSIASGSSIITDTIFHDRFTHVAELKRLGADITLDNNVAVVKGSEYLSGAPVMSTDLRASASLILAGLVARGRTDVSRVYHIDRGYEKIEEKLKSLGAEIWRDREALIT
ncbi:UDP-N-acetylglucosamine 1-carboxyvinyltransferase [bacterium]|nr:UDP-N-acetylglucosamine 1-carboxyvinyltransferase [bacterium]